ncbi:MAG: hypothetical protein JWN95_1408 [Frankiales bacterium]|nr:hypothetical protein [Frankiales bacterium]
MPGGRKVRVVVRLTDDEFDRIAARAAEIKQTVPSYLALTGLRPEGVASSDIKAALIALREIQRVNAGVANNLNQLTAKLHATGELDASLRAAVGAAAGLSVRLDAVIGRVGQLVDGRRRTARKHPTHPCRNKSLPASFRAPSICGVDDGTPDHELS